MLTPDHSGAAEWPLRPAEPLAESRCRVEEARRERGKVSVSGCVSSGPFQVKANGKKNSEPHKAYGRLPPGPTRSGEIVCGPAPYWIVDPYGAKQLNTGRS